jgi:hypothetical protein
MPITLQFAFGVRDLHRMGLTAEHIAALDAVVPVDMAVAHCGRNSSKERTAR